MTKLVLGRVSRISFQTDMTRGDAPVISLGFILEAAWDKRARWMGLIGRTRLNDFELTQVNLKTWPDLRTPFTLLDGMFEKGWEGAWGAGGTAIENSWLHSAILVQTEAKALDERFRADTKKYWAETDRLLVSELHALAHKLAPLMPPKPTKIIAIPAVREIKQVENRELAEAA